MTNTGAPVSLTLLGSQTIWAYSEFIRRATDPSAPSIEKRGMSLVRQAAPGHRSRCRSSQQPQGSRIGRGALALTASKSLSPVTSRSAPPAAAEASTQRSSGSRSRNGDGSAGLGTMVCSRNCCSTMAISAAGTRRRPRRTRCSLARLTAPVRSSCSARTSRKRSELRPRAVKALMRTFVSRNTLRTRLGTRSHRSGSPGPPRRA